MRRFASLADVEAERRTLTAGEVVTVNRRDGTMRRLWHRLIGRLRKPLCPICGRPMALIGAPGKRKLCGCCWAAIAQDRGRQLSEAMVLRCTAGKCRSRRL